MNKTKLSKKVWKKVLRDREVNLCKLIFDKYHYSMIINDGKLGKRKEDIIKRINDITAEIKSEDIKISKHKDKKKLSALEMEALTLKKEAEDIRGIFEQVDMIEDATINNLKVISRLEKVIKNPKLIYGK